MKTEPTSHHRIVIADDHAIVRSGLRQLLQQAAGLQVVGEARSGAQLLDLLLLARNSFLGSFLSDEAVTAHLAALDACAAELA